MQVVNADLISGKKVLLRLDIDVPLRQAQGKQKSKLEVAEDFRLRAGLDTLRLCLEYATQVIVIGHVGRPFAYAEDEKKGWPKDLSAEPVAEWYKKELGEEVEFTKSLEQVEKSTSKLVMLENIRFFHGEITGPEYHQTCTSKTCDVDFTRKLAFLGDFFVNEAFASYNPAASTTILPTLLPHACGLRFAEEVRVLTGVRNNPKKPFVAIMGGAKVADKLPVIEVLAKTADAVLVGGKLVHELRAGSVSSLSPALPPNVLIGKLTEDGFDIAPETTKAWSGLISRAKTIVWNGPVGKFEDPKNDQSAKLARLVLDSGAEVVVGGGDTISLLGSLGILREYEKKAFSASRFISTGGGAMLKFLSDGTLPTIEVLS